VSSLYYHSRRVCGWRNRHMPLPDCSCKIINGETGYVRDNTSWVIGRIVRDFEYWVDDSEYGGGVTAKVESLQHAIVILGCGKGLALEDLAAAQTNVNVSASYWARIMVTVLAAF